MSDFIHRVTTTAGAKLIRGLERIMAWGSLVGNPAFFKPEQFPWTRELNGNWRIIRRELEGVLEQPEVLPNFQDLSVDQKHLSNDDKWKTFFFCAYGFSAEANCRRCPETTRLIEAVPGMKSAFFSILAPGKHIPRHRGPFKGVIRYHLGLIVPEPREKCRIQVGEQFAHWEEGECLVFDDTYFHEVWNDTNGTRVVLFMDVVRPLRFPANLLNWLILKIVQHSPFVKDGVENYRKWEAKLDQFATATQQGS